MNSLVKGSMLIAAGTVYKILLTVLIDKFLANQLGVEGFGAYKYGITIVLLLSTFCTLGLGSSIIRTIVIQASFDEKKILISISIILVVLTSLPLVIVGLTKNSLFGVDSTFLFATVFFSVNSLFNSIYSGLEKPTSKVLINDIFGFTLYMFVLWIYFELEGKADQVAYAYLLYVIFVFLVNLVSSRKLFKKINKEYILGNEFIEYIKYSSPLFGVSVLIVLSANMDKIILKYFVSEEQLGIYYAAFNISNLLPLILTILVFLYLPRMSKYLQNGKIKKATLLSSYFSKWTMIMASIFFGVIVFHAENIIVLLYSDKFSDGVFILKVLALGQWINVSLGFTGQNLLAFGDSKSQLYIRIVAFSVGAVLLFLGARYYGNIGASISIVITLVFSNFLQIYILKIKHNFLGYRKQNLFAFVVIVLAGISLSYLHKLSYIDDMNFIILVFIDIFLFLLVLLIAKVVNGKDIRVLNITEGR